MKQAVSETRRQLLRRVALGLTLTPLFCVSPQALLAADAPLVSEDDPTAKALKYTHDVSTTREAKPGSKCATCALYQGGGAPVGGCLLFPGKSVKAAGWCSSWTPKAT